MPRYPRISLTDIPVRIIQRGHDRQPVFIQPADYEKYLSNLADIKDRYDIQVLAYCLMTNHVHMVVSPRGEPSNISAMMRVLAVRHATSTSWRNELEHSGRAASRQS